jgi:alpha-amylase
LKQLDIFKKSSELNDRYFDDELNKQVFEKVASKCYIPANEIILKNLRENTEFKVSFSLSGSFIEQAELFNPELIESFREMAETGRVEFLNETYYHSLASLYNDKKEFRRQVFKHAEKIRKTFGVKTKSFRNTELIYDNNIAKEVEKLGYETILTEGKEHVLGWKSPDYVYKARGSNIKILFRNYKLSDDVGYRFTAKWWKEYPLTADKYAFWIDSGIGDVANIFIDYESFGEHHWADSGILNFLDRLPKELSKRNIKFETVSEASRHEVKDEIDVPYLLSWADIERDVSAWLGNRMQRHCFNELQDIKTENSEMLDVYGNLQNSDHLYYLCTKSWNDGDVHKYFSPYKDKNPYENFVNYINILRDFKEEVLIKTRKKILVSGL